MKSSQTRVTLRKESNLFLCFYVALEDKLHNFNCALENFLNCKKQVMLSTSEQGCLQSLKHILAMPKRVPAIAHQTNIFNS